MKMVCTGGYRQLAVWRPCGVTQHVALQNKSVVCSGSRVTNSTVMKLHGSDYRGGIIVQTYTKSTCSQKQTKKKTTTSNKTKANKKQTYLDGILPGRLTFWHCTEDWHMLYRQGVMVHRMHDWKTLAEYHMCDRKMTVAHHMQRISALRH